VSEIQGGKEKKDMRTYWLVLALVALCVLGAGAAACAAEQQGPPAVEVHGWMLTRYYVNTVVDATRDSLGRITSKQEEDAVKTERISLSGLARLANGKTAYAEIYIHPWLMNFNPQPGTPLAPVKAATEPSALYLESLYVDIPAGPGAKFRIGKGRNMAFGIVPTYGNRKTSNYSPLAEMYTMDRVLGIQYMQTRGKDSLAFAILNSPRPGTRSIGQAADVQLDRNTLSTTTVTHLTDRDVPADRSGELEFSTRLGRQMGVVNTGISGRIGAMDKTDAAFLASKFPTYNGSNRTLLRYGLDTTYSAMPFYGTFEYYAGSTGGIRHSGWAVLLGVEPSAQCTAPWRSMSGACKGLFVRYGALDIDVPPIADVKKSITWDTRQLAVSYVYPLRMKRYTSLPKWLQFEYERNKDEAPGGLQEIPNNLLFVELFSAF
jgi:hypothetical protein